MRRRCHNWVSGGLEASDNQTTSWIGQPTHSIPGFYKSDMVKDIPESVEQSIMGPLRTLKSNSVSGLVKTRRLALCFDVANELRSDMIELMFESLIYAELGRTMSRK
jgi:hypothetical protein